MTTNEEVPIKEALRVLVSDEDLSDVKLEGTDGVLVCANRGLLAVRSPVFRSMLFGKFAESRKDGVVKIGYSSCVLKSIVEYCFTDEAQLLKSLDKDDTSAKDVSSVISLVDAANYFVLPGLKRFVEDVACSTMKKNARLACLFFAEAKPPAEKIESLALEMIRSQPTKALEESAVVSLSKSSVEKIMRDDKIMACELTMFRVLKVWVDGGKDAADCEVRRRVAEGMARHVVALERISARDLIREVEPSGLIASDQLLEAYRKKALRAEDRPGESFDIMRNVRLGAWQSSGSEWYACKADSHVVELLEDDTILRSGVWRWSCKVERWCSYVWTGVASTSHTLDKDRWLGMQTGGWVYGSNGSACAATGEDNGPYDNSHPCYFEGSVLTMTLDLTDTGTLSVRIDNGRPRLLFSAMLSFFREGQEIGFLPAVSMRSPGMVRFLGLEKLPS